ncbi:MAG: DUF3821 domain-containing protein [Methanoregula sp.]
MMSGTTKIFLAAILGIFLAILPVSATITQISQGNTVFLGEDGLDVTNAMGPDSQIGWWASGADILHSAPSGNVPITSKTQFSVTPTLFGSQLGTWYRIDAAGKVNGTAFIVADPSLLLRVEDTSVNVDVSQNKWVYRGDEIGFRIETNLNAIAQRPGAPAALITIKVQPPAGGTYSALVNNAGVHMIENIPVSTSPFTTGPWWDTGNSIYAPGTYTIWAECNVNHMKDNYGVTGKTLTTQTAMLNTERNPLISVSVPTTGSTTQGTQTQVMITTTKSPTVTTTIPKTSPTTVVLTVTPTVSAATMSQTSNATLAAPVKTTTKKSPGFEMVSSLIALSGIALVILTRKK